MPELKPDDPTPDPEVGHPVDALSETQAPPPGRGTTFVDVVEAAKEVAKEIDTSDGVQAEEIVDAAFEGAAKILGDDSEHPPLSHHAISELRRLLVPLLTAIIAALAGGGLVGWQAGDAKDEAVKEAEVRADEKIQEAEDHQRLLERIRTEVRKEMLKNASWDEVGLSLDLGEDAVAITAMKSYRDGLAAVSSGEVTINQADILILEELVHNEAAQIQAQTNLPPRPDGVATSPR